MKRDVGLYRITPNSLIVESCFDWETKTIGPFYSKDIGLGYNEDYHEKYTMPNKRILYAVMKKYPTAEAAFFVNNKLVVIFDLFGVKYIDLDNSNTEVTRWTYQSILPEDLEQAGFVKTRYRCVSIHLTPACLGYSKSKKAVTVDGIKWCTIPNCIRPGYDIKAYAELVKSEFEAVLQDINNDYIMLTKEEVY